MGTNNSKIEQDDELNFQVETTDTKLYQQHNNNSSEQSQKNLIHKFHNSFYGTPSAQGSSERIEQSDSSLSSLPYKTKKLLFKKNKKKQSTSSSNESEQNTSFLSAQTTSVDDPMTAAVERLSARFKNETLISSSDSCSDAQRRLECIESDKSTNDSRLSLEKTHSCNSTSHKHDTCYEKWLSTTLETPKQKILQQERKQREKQKEEPLTSRDSFFDTFFGATNESERRKEKDRQQRMHYLLKRIWNGIYRAELIDPKTIVNWCCGIGVWDMEMALLFPETKVIGIDFEGATSSNLQHGLESIESNTVDFVMMRDVWLINAPVQKWFNVLRESYRILKPGGWIEIAEHLLKIESQGPKLKALDTYFEVFFTKTQVDRHVCLKLSKYLEDTGFVQVDELSADVPLGEWCATSSKVFVGLYIKKKYWLTDLIALKEIGFLTRDLLDRRIRSLSKWVAEANDIEESELSKIISESLEEETDLFHSRMHWTSFTGRKPLI